MKKGFLIVLLAIAASSASALEAGSKRLQNFLDTTERLSSSFVQVVRDEYGRELQRSEGAFYLQRPDQFRWAYMTPDRVVVIADGRQVWVYEEDLDQVSVASQDEALKGSPAELLTSSVPLSERFNILDIGLSEAYQWVELQPKQEEADFSQIRLGFGPKTLRRMELVDLLGNRTQVEFSQVKLNPTIDTTLFEYEQQHGVDVID